MDNAVSTRLHVQRKQQCAVAAVGHLYYCWTQATNTKVTLTCLHNSRHVCSRPGPDIKGALWRVSTSHCLTQHSTYHSDSRMEGSATLLETCSRVCPQEYWPCRQCCLCSCRMCKHKLLLAHHRYHEIKSHQSGPHASACECCDHQ